MHEYPMGKIHFESIITNAWNAFDDTKTIQAIEDASPRVSTNSVFKLTFVDRAPVYAKLSYYGKYEHFREDHVIINNLANNLETPYETFLARSLTKNNDVFIYQYDREGVNAWVVFYNPIKVKNRMPRKLQRSQIEKMGVEMALFHQACDNIRGSLPKSSKTLQVDINSLIVDTHCRKDGLITIHKNYIREHCDRFMEGAELVDYNSFRKIPVFVDWNIGNFSVGSGGNFYSRWDYDWFRVADRVLDMYFMSRVVSEAGDRTVFSYWLDTLMEERFLVFLQAYHKVFPLSRNEVLFIKDAYRFFILNYVIKDGSYFFSASYAEKLQQEALRDYLPSIDDRFDADVLLRALNL